LPSRILLACALALALPACTTTGGPGSAMAPGAATRPVAEGSIQKGSASYYKSGRRTANGERFNPGGMTAAHRTLPFGTRVQVVNQSNGQSVVVRINDRGPFIRGRVIDLSLAAGRQIGLVAMGHAPVEIRRLD